MLLLARAAHDVATGCQDNNVPRLVTNSAGACCATSRSLTGFRHVLETIPRGLDEDAQRRDVGPASLTRLPLDAVLPRKLQVGEA